MKRLFYFFVIFLQKIFPRHAIPVLMYHQVNNSESKLAVLPDTFYNQMLFLKKLGYASLDLQDFQKEISSKKISKKKVLITFDDGFKDNYIVAKKILEEFGFKGIFFITSGYISKKAEFCKTEIDRNMDMMNHEELYELSKKHILGNHFVTHRNLTELPEEQIVSEFFECQKTLQLKTHQMNNIKSIAYPRGKTDERIKTVLKKVGVELAFGGRPGVSSNTSDIYDISRIEVHKKDSLLKFRAKISPYYYGLKNFYGN